jgi:methionyl-tRNA synthetase
MGINLFRLLMIYLKPILPETAKHVEEFLNITPLTWQDKNTALLNHRINEFKPLITRIDPKQIEALKMDAAPEVAPEVIPEKQYISIDDFAKIDLRIATILEAEGVEGADKLLRLKVDVGTETKQIFAGIKASFEPEKLIGRQVIIVANLAPRKMRFGMSEGMMIVAGDGEGSLFIVSPDEGAKAGMKVK